MKDIKTEILSANGTSIFYLGQAGFVFKSRKGTILGVDMYLTDSIERTEGHVGFKRLLPVMISPGDILFDYVVTTHPHHDHFDPDAIPILMANHHTRLFASEECEKEVKLLRMTNRNITYVRPGDKAQADDISIEFTDCDHGEGAPDAFGLIINLDGQRIYIAGDTCLHTEMAEKVGKVDIMIAPINGAYGNLNEKECYELAKAVKPGVTIPCHYGMFAVHGCHPGVFINYMKEDNLPFYLMTVGEKVLPQWIL